MEIAIGFMQLSPAFGNTGEDPRKGKYTNKRFQKQKLLHQWYTIIDLQYIITWILQPQAGFSSLQLAENNRIR